MKKKLLVALLVFSLAMVAFASTAFASTPVTVQVDGVVVEFEEAAPVMVEGRVLVPVRGVFEHMGFEVWYEEGVAFLESDDFIIIIVTGEETFIVNGESVTPDVPQQVVDGNMLLPLRAVAEAVGGYPVWDAENRVANILTPEVEEPDEPTDEDDDYPADEGDDDDDYPANGEDENGENEDENDEDNNDENGNDEDDNDEGDDYYEFFYAPLVGSWHFDTTDFNFTTWTYVFNADNTGVLITDMNFDAVVELSFVWAVVEDFLGIAFDEYLPATWYAQGWESLFVSSFNVDGDTLTLGEDDYVYVYTRR